MKQRILFVDDEQHLLDALERMLHRQRDQWEMTFVSSGLKAIQCLEVCQFDVIASDMRMPKMDGVQLLTHVMNHYPKIVRIILSGYTDQEKILESIGTAHQFLSKPCDADTLISAISRTTHLQTLLQSDSLQRLATQIDVLPSPPEIYMNVLQELQEKEPSIKRIGQLIMQDLGISTKILQLVNSAFFGITKHISSPDQAVILLGLNTIRGIILKLIIHGQCEPAVGQIKHFSLEALSQHALAVSAIAKTVAKAQNAHLRMLENTFLAGLFHDIGQLVLAATQTQLYTSVLQRFNEEEVALWQLEKQVFGATHAEVGAYLLGLWGMPASVVEAVAYHHCPSDCQINTFSPLTAVHVANVLEHEISFPQRANLTPIDMDHLEHLQLADRMDYWRRLTCVKKVA